MMQWRDRGVVPDSDDDDDEDAGELSLDCQPWPAVGIGSKEPSQQCSKDVGSDAPQAGHLHSPIPTKPSQGQHSVDQSAILRPEKPSTNTEAENHRRARDVYDIPSSQESVHRTSKIKKGRHATSEQIEGKIGHHLPLPVDSLSQHSELQRQSRDISSSPLSDVPTTQSSLEATNGAPSTPLTDPRVAKGLEEEQHLLPNDFTAPEAQHGRNFRARNPIQLHPYEYDRQQYYRTLNGTGYRPVRVLDKSPQSRQEFGDAADGNNSDSSSFAEGFLSSRSPTPPFIGGDFPDMDPAERVAHFGETRDGSKRRKLDGNERKTQRSRKAFRRKEFRFPEGYGPQAQNTSATPTGNPSTAPLDGLNDSESDVSDVVQSTRRAPTKPYSTLLLDSDSDAEDASTSRKALPSPIQIDSAAKDDPHVHSDDNGQESALRPSPVDAREFQRVRKRIKGVLPASWLRIDQAQKKAVTEDRRKMTSPTKAIARPRMDNLIGDGGSVAPSPQTSDARPRTLLMFESSSDDEASQLATPATLQRVELLSPVTHRATFSSFIGEVQENDWIDDMRPTASRPRASKSGRKRQSRLTDAFHQPVARPDTRNERAFDNRTHSNKGLTSTKSSRREHQGRSHTTGNRARFVPPRLSILDAPDYNNGQHLPDFIRIAARKAKSRPDKGRQSPRKKQISLHSREDGIDVDQTLQAWASASIVPSIRYISEKDKGSSRQPLGETSHNRQPTLSTMRMIDREEHNYGKLPRSSHAQKSRSIGPQKVRVRQSRLKFPAGEHENSNRPVHSAATSESTSHQKGIKPKRQQDKFSRPPDYTRPGMLEELQKQHDNIHKRSAFHRGLLQVNKTDERHFPYEASTKNSVLARFLYEDDREANVFQNDDDEHPPETVIHTSRPDKDGPSIPGGKRRLKKRIPQQLQLVETEAHQQPTIDSVVVVDDYHGSIAQSSQPGQPAKSSYTRIEGLLPSGAVYTIDFGTAPLPVGMCFHDSTFIGSGALSKACAMEDRNLSLDSGEEIVATASNTYRLGAWTQETSSHLQDIFNHLTDALEILTEDSPLISESSTMRSVVSWMSDRISFLDTIDQQSCVTLIGLLERLLDVCQNAALRNNNMGNLSLFWLHLVTFAAQLLQLASSPVIQATETSRCQRCFEGCAKIVMECVIKSSTTELYQFHDRLQLRHACESGIRGANAIETVVGLFILTERYSSPRNDFWTLLQVAIIPSSLTTTSDICVLETAWHILFAILPLCEFDGQGIHKRYRRFQVPSESWTLVNALLARTLELYATSHNSSCANPYIRTLLSRCHRLIKTWAWRNWDTTIKKIYDFFAHRGFHLLSNESGRGSVSFLEHLDVETEPKLDATDPSFHTFLKTLANGLVQLRALMTDKRILNITWRFIPNHGRIHKKEDDLRHEDLDAMRNQHDLFCVLYYASPPAARPKLQLVRALADFKSSHLEICRLNVKAWARLTKFQLSTNEPIESVQPLLNWFNDMLKQLLMQYTHARTEAEAFAHDSMSANSSELFESIVRSNQRQIEALLSTLVNCLADILKNGKNEATVQYLFQGASLASAFGLYVPGTTRLLSLINEVLSVYEAVTSRRDLAPREAILQQSNEESQDYGSIDLDDLDEAIPDADSSRGTFEPNKAYDALHDFVSNCFGSERSIDERLLERAVNTYVRVLHDQVLSGYRQWNYYLHEHGDGSWSRFRNTEAASRFLPYFVASIVDSDSTSFIDNASDVFSTWMVTLAERESMLKYQYRLTNSMLNAWPSHPLLRNLPFTSKPLTRCYGITLQEFRERRLSLISTILENMRRICHEDANVNGHVGSTQAAGVDIRHALRAFQSTMKHIYEETGSGSSTRGSYITFVQQVVSFLQQYTADIAPVDRFFTDGSTAFPLPVEDPTYLVGKLKAYAPKLSDSRTQKQLAAFVLNAFVRAAIDNQGAYLVDQISKSMKDQFEIPGAPGGMTLRRVLTQIIFPVYVRAAFERPCGWIVALPIFSILDIVLGTLLAASDLTSVQSMSPALDMISVNLTVLLTALRFCSKANSEAIGKGQPNRHEEMLGVRTTNLIAETCRIITSSLPIVTFAQHLQSSTSTEIVPALRLIGQLRETIHAFEQESLVQVDLQEPVSAPGPSSHAALVDYAARDLFETLEKEWSFRAPPGGPIQYFVTRGRNLREIAEPRVVNASVSKVVAEFETQVQRELRGKSRRTRMHSCKDMII